MGREEPSFANTPRSSDDAWVDTGIWDDARAVMIFLLALGLLVAGVGWATDSLDEELIAAVFIISGIVMALVVPVLAARNPS